MKTIEHLAIAVRDVGVLEEIETMWAEPVDETWVSFGEAVVVGGCSTDGVLLVRVGVVVVKRRVGEGLKD